MKETVSKVQCINKVAPEWEKVCIWPYLVAITLINKRLGRCFERFVVDIKFMEISFSLSIISYNHFEKLWFTVSF